MDSGWIRVHRPFESGTGGRGLQHSSEACQQLSAVESAAFERLNRGGWQDLLDGLSDSERMLQLLCRRPTGLVGHSIDLSCQGAWKGHCGVCLFLYCDLFFVV